MTAVRRAAALGDDRVRQNAAELSQALAPPPTQAVPGMAERVRVAQGMENVRSCGKYSC
nr:hypothetical protein [uncultured Lichenicoccus sp.]